MSVVTFGASVALNLPPTSAFKTGGTTAASVINQVDCGSWTNTSDAYWTAYQQLVAISQPLALNVIVFFTDGVPTALSANLPIRTQTSSISGTTYGPSTCADDSGRASGNASWGQPYQNGLPYIAPKLGVWAYGNGMYNPVTSGFSTNDPIIVAAGCSFTSDSNSLWRDVAFLPETDRNGASTSGAKPLIRFPSGHPYEGRIATGEDANDVAVTWNAADNTAATARADTSLNPVTYTIGLGSNGGVDDDLLRRMANDAASSSFNPARPVGRYIFAATADDLNRAFSEVASDTLRLVR